MFKIPIKSYYVKDIMPDHESIKKDVLSIIENDTSNSLEDTNNFYENKISKVDFFNHGDVNRPWVKRIMPELLNQIGKMTNSLGYFNIHLKALWYQQYNKNDIHDWHIHGENFTGVYYLEFPESAPSTQLFDDKVFAPDVKEGDICIFPAMTPHIAPKIESDVRKTIISYNFNVMELNHNKLKEIKYGSL